MTVTMGCTPAPQVSHNKGKILLKTLEQLSIDNLTLMNSCIEFDLQMFKAADAELYSASISQGFTILITPAHSDIC
jgi:hypothetical protein